MAEPEPFAVAPLEAIDYQRRKIGLPTRTWTDIWQGQHAAAFVVAGANTESLVADFQEAVNRNVAEGRTLEQFRGDFDTIVARHGWSYKGSRGWRSRVIFETNLRMSYASGRWAQIQRVKQDRPYIRYVSVMDGRERPQHHAWHDTVLHADDPWWHTHYPPNGWGCRCTPQSLNARDVQRLGLKVATEAPPVHMVKRQLRTPTGLVTIDVPDGIDPGFAYNPGIAGFGGGPDLLALEEHGEWSPLQVPWDKGRDALQPLPLDQAKATIPHHVDKTEAALRQLLRDSIGGEEATYVDPAGGHIHVSQAVVTHLLDDPQRLDGRERYLPLIPELLTAPAEIWIGFARDNQTGRIGLRRRYVKFLQFAKKRVAGLVADADGHRWSGLTYFYGKGRGGGLREGYLLFRRL